MLLRCIAIGALLLRSEFGFSDEDTGVHQRGVLSRRLFGYHGQLVRAVGTFLDGFSVGWKVAGLM